MLKVSLLLFFSLISQMVFSQKFLKEGDKVIPFSIKTTDGKIIEVGKTNGKVIYLNFFATWCPPCIKELPYVEKKIWKTIKNTNFVMVALGREHSVAEMIEFKKQKKFTMPIAADSNRKVFSLFAPQDIPRNVVIDKDGKILWNKSGFNEKELEQMISLIRKKLE